MKLSLLAKRLAVSAVALAIAASSALLPDLSTPALASQANSVAFDTTPHNDVSIEWWYLFAHVTTKTQRHLALVISFFRFANPTAAQSASVSGHEADRHLNHYLLCAVTDEDTAEHQTFSLADKNSLGMMQTLSALALLINPHDSHAKAMEALAEKGELPAPSLVIPGGVNVRDSKSIDATYGSVASLKAIPGQLNTYALTFDSPEHSRFNLVFHGARAPMNVGGTAMTGIVRPDDMYYKSLTRTIVTGTITTYSPNSWGVNQAKTESVASGTGWFDHQWGSSWTPTAVGWDWFGIQLADGRDILLFRQRHLNDASTFGTLATIEGPDGHLTVTRNITFTANTSALWTSAKTGVTYPLGWTLTLPDQNLSLDISAPIQNQELPALGNPGGAIWEGTVNVSASPIQQADLGQKITGVGYMELVGYGSPAVSLSKAPTGN